MCECRVFGKFLSKRGRRLDCRLPFLAPLTDPWRSQLIVAKCLSHFLMPIVLRLVPRVIICGKARVVATRRLSSSGHSCVLLGRAARWHVDAWQMARRIAVAGPTNLVACSVRAEFTNLVLGVHLAGVHIYAHVVRVAGTGLTFTLVFIDGGYLRL